MLIFLLFSDKISGGGQKSPRGERLPQEGALPLWKKARKCKWNKILAYSKGTVHVQLLCILLNLIPKATCDSAKDEPRSQ